MNFLLNFNYIFTFYFFFSIFACCFLFLIKNQQKLKVFILYSLIFSFCGSIFFFFLFEKKLKISSFYIKFNFLNIKFFNFFFSWNLDYFSLIFLALTTFILILFTLWSWNYTWDKKPLYIFFPFLDFLLKVYFLVFDIHILIYI